MWRCVLVGVVWLSSVSCSKRGTVERVTTWQTDLGGALVVAAGIARLVAIEADQGDGAAGCMAGEIVGSVLTSAGYQIASTAPGAPSDTRGGTVTFVDYCRCLSMRADWDPVAVPDEIATYTTATLDGVTLLVGPHLRSCEARAWLASTSAAVRGLVEPIAAALTLDACTVPIPDIVPDLSACTE